MKILLFVACISAAQISPSNRHPIFGVYRGVLTPTQNCTVSILEQTAYKSASVLIDQNPYLFVSSPLLLEQVSNHSSKISLDSIETNRQGHVDLLFDSKNKIIEVHTTFNGVMSRCEGLHQIRKQD